jgi:hypothetical protein
LCGNFAAKGARIHVVDEGALAVDLDDGQPFAIGRLELRIAADVDLLELEGNLDARLLDDRPGALAEVAPLRVVEGDSPYG